MTFLEVYVAVILPLVILGLGFGAVKWNEWDLKRRDRMHPGE